MPRWICRGAAAIVAGCLAGAVVLAQGNLEDTRRRAEQGDAAAQFWLGASYAAGVDVDKDEAKAAHWFQLAAMQGEDRAQNRLGNMYAEGRGVEQDYSKAVRWYRLAAEQGYASAQFNLGLMYSKGEGVSQDYGEAVKWYRLVAEQGYASAQFNLGLMYDKGEGVPQDYGEAVKWYRLAADQGNASAQINLGLMHAKGEGVPQNYIQAHMWLNLAGARGDEEARKARDIVKDKMTPEQIAEAQRLASVWKPGMVIDAPAQMSELPSDGDALQQWDDDGNGRITCAEARRHGLAPGCLRCLLLVMYMHPFSKEALTLHLARSEGHERYFGCNLMHRRVLVSSHQHLMAEAPDLQSPYGLPPIPPRSLSTNILMR